MKKLIIAIICILLCINLVSAVVIEIPLTGDARVENDIYSDNNYGSSLQLKVGKYTTNAMRTHLKSDISSLDSIDFTQVELVLYKLGGSGTTGTALHQVDDDSWEESTITWNNAPAIGTQIATQDIPPGASEVSFDVTASVVSSLAAQDNIVSFMLKSTDESEVYNYKIFFSRENPSNTPFLRVAYEPNSPVIDSWNVPASAYEGELVGLSFTATDAEADIVAMSISIDGELLVMDNSGSWQTSFEDSGVHTIQLYVEDSTGLSDTQEVQIPVNNVENIVINEFLPYSSPPGTEWVELFNPLQDMNVNDCYLTDGAGFIIPLTGLIPAGSYGVITELSILNNEGDILELFCSGVLVDSVAYGNYDDGADNALVAPVASSLARSPNGHDTDNDLNDFVISEEPTMGSENGEYHDADTDHDGCVSMGELLAFIGLWKQDPIGVGMENLLSGIAIWKSNPMCTE